MAEPAPAPRSRDAERTRAEVLDVAGEVFAEAGLSGARVDEIAARTSTTKRMLYYYFGSKEGLYLAVLERAYRGIRQVETALDPGDLAPAEVVRRIAQLTFDHHHEHPDFIRLVAIENIHGGRYLRRLERLDELGPPAVTVLEDVLARGAATGEFRRGVTAIDVHMLISAFCVFQVANNHTFGYLFRYDMTSPSVRARNRAMIGDVVVSWLTAGPAAP
jgi:AcrR family transcriptional regulator